MAGEVPLVGCNHEGMVFEVMVNGMAICRICGNIRGPGPDEFWWSFRPASIVMSNAALKKLIKSIKEES